MLSGHQKKFLRDKELPDFAQKFGNSIKDVNLTLDAIRAMSFSTMVLEDNQLLRAKIHNLINTFFPFSAAMGDSTPTKDLSRFENQESFSSKKNSNSNFKSRSSSGGMIEPEMMKSLHKADSEIERKFRKKNEVKKNSNFLTLSLMKEKAKEKKLPMVITILLQKRGQFTAQNNLTEITIFKIKIFKKKILKIRRAL